MQATRILVAAWIAAMASAEAVAQEAQPPTSAESMVVTATRTEKSAFDIPVAIDVVSGDELRAHRAGVDLSEGLGTIPGIVVQNRYNYAQDLQVSARGFGARASFGVRGVRLIQDGIPLTMPDGQGQTALFDLAAQIVSRCCADRSRRSTATLREASFISSLQTNGARTRSRREARVVKTAPGAAP